MNSTLQENRTWSTTHRISAEDKTAMSAMRIIVEPNKGRLQGTAARVPFDAIMERVAAPAGVTYEAGTVGGVSGRWCRPEDPKSGEAILHIHGGWFNWARRRPSGISLAIWLFALVWQHSCPTIGSHRSIPFRQLQKMSAQRTLVWSKAAIQRLSSRATPPGAILPLAFLFISRPTAQGRP